MNKASSNIYKNARIRAGFKREPIAEELHIDVRTLDKYEALDGRAPDEIVKQMCILYDNKFLAWQHMKLSPLGEFLPTLQEDNLKGATLNMVNDIYSVNDIIREIVQIAADGEIDEQEQPLWRKNKTRLLQLVSSLMSVLLLDKEE